MKQERKAYNTAFTGILITLAALGVIPEDFAGEEYQNALLVALGTIYTAGSTIATYWSRNEPG